MKKNWTWNFDIERKSLYSNKRPCVDIYLLLRPSLIDFWRGISIKKSDSSVIEWIMSDSIAKGGSNSISNGNGVPDKVVANKDRVSFKYTYDCYLKMFSQ